MKSSGIALVSVLLCLVVSLVLAATLFFSWFVDAQVTANGSAGEDALAVAEAGVQHLWSILEPAPSFTRELAWSAGEPPFGAVVGFPEAPRTYRVRVSPVAGGKLAVIAEGTSRRGTRRSVEATFSRAPFRPPATLVVGPETALADASGTVDVTEAGEDPEIPAVAGEARAEALALRTAGGGFGGAVVVGPSGLADAASALAGAANATYADPQSSGAWGNDAAPAITRLVGNAEILGDVSATGIVVAEAPLRIRGRLEVRGLLLAPAGLEITGELVIEGAARIATELRLAASGLLVLIDSPAGLAAAAMVGRDVLPRPVVLSAWREAW